MIWGAGRHYRGDVGPPRSNHRSHPGTGEFKSSTDWPLIPRLTVVLGVNSLDIRNFGHETGPSSGPNSILAYYYSLDMSQNSNNDLGKVLGLILGQEKCLLNCNPYVILTRQR